MVEWTFKSADYHLSANPTPSLSDALRTFDSVLAHYKTLGIDTVTISTRVPINPVSGALESSFSNANFPTAPASYLSALTADAHAQGFKVVWAPGFMMDTPDAPLVNSQTAPGINVQGFLNSVDQYWRATAPLAQQNGVEMLVLGQEHTGYAQDPYTANWLQIIADTRASYSGKLTYSDITSPDGTGHLTIDAIKFWGALDYIGAENWLPIQVNGAPNSFFSMLGWPGMETPTNVVSALYSLSQQYGKEVYFQTFGNKSDTAGWTDPASSVLNGVIDYQAQYQFYKQFLDTFQNFSWVVGASSAHGDADWMPDTSVPGWNSSFFWQDGYSIYDKPAAEVLAGYWLHDQAAPPLPVLSVSGPSTNYSMVAGPSTVTLHSSTGPDQMLFENQPVQFSDQTINTTWFTQAATLSASEFAPLIELYIASFNRAPDAVGLGYWAAQFADGMSLPQIAASFFTQHEAAIAYPAGQSTTDFVNAVYGNVLGRAADAGGLSYWASQLQTGVVAKDTFLLALINGADGTGDAVYLTNKQLVGAHFALTQGLTDPNEAKTVMAGVTSATASVTAANQLTDGFAASATGHELVVQIVGIAP